MNASPLITRTDLRLALTAGLSAGFVIMLGLPDPFYAPLAVGAALGGTVGATRLLGTQRVLGTLLGGVIVAILGILGIYLGKTYDETKCRPLYVINHTTFDD